MIQILRCIILVTAIVASCKASIAEEDVFSANAAMPGCREAENYHSPNIYKRGLCMGIVSTLLDLDPKICLPPSVTNFQAVRVVVKYIDARPARLHESFKALAGEALRAAWPCKK
jgi:Ssp1 endopeptidase immunity protein Rap1a